jgi:hypothetical protein
VKLFNKDIPRSILVWVIHHQQWPTLQVDHVDSTNPLNDRIENLRLASRSQNKANSTIYSNNSSGYKGVYWHRQACKWKAQIGVNGKRVYLGLFNKREEAHAAYCEAAKKAFGAFARFE